MRPIDISQLQRNTPIQTSALKYTSKHWYTEIHKERDKGKDCKHDCKYHVLLNLNLSSKWVSGFWVYHSFMSSTKCSANTHFHTHTRSICVLMIRRGPICWWWECGQWFPKWCYLCHRAKAAKSLSVSMTLVWFTWKRC